jgi:cold shock CspA family protein
MTGTIKSLNARKGFGFIRGLDSVEYFFHRSSLQNGRIEELVEGRTTVTFKFSHGMKGPRADEVWVEK